MRNYSLSVDQRLADRFVYLGLILFFYKWLSQVPIPFLSLNLLLDQLSSLPQLNSTQLSPVLSVSAAGIAPYLYASSILEFATLSIPSLKKNRELGGSAWVKQLNLWKRYLATGFIVASSWQKCYGLSYGLFSINTLDFMILMSVFISGGLFVIWMAETLSIYTLSIGSNILIMFDILSDLGRLSLSQLFSFKAGILLFVVLWGSLALTEAQRKLPLVVSRLTGESSRELPKVREDQPAIDDYLSISIVPGGSTLSILTLALCLFVVGFLKSSSSLVLQLAATAATLLVYYLVSRAFVDFALNTEEITKSLRKMSVSLYGVKSGPSTLKYLNDVKAVLFLIPFLSTAFFILAPFLTSIYIKNSENPVFSFVPSLFLIYSIYNDLFYKVSAYLKLDD